jgi:DUF4097 and DUF4098 domain-containing protein YvlB
MTSSPTSGARTETYPAAGQVKIDIEPGVGHIRVVATERSDIVIEVRPSDAGRRADLKAAEATTIDEVEGAITVRAPKDWRRFAPFGDTGSVDVTVSAPVGAEIRGRSEMGTIDVEGPVGDASLRTGMGAIRVGEVGSLFAHTGYGEVSARQVGGDADVSTGSGEIRVGQISGAAGIKNSNGRIEVTAVGGDLNARTANGDVVIGKAGASVSAKTANGNVRVHSVGAGAAELETSVGEIEIGIKDGTRAWLDLSTRFGHVRNMLGTTDGPGEGPTVEVRARTSAGDIVVRRAQGDD